MKSQQAIEQTLHILTAMEPTEGRNFNFYLDLMMIRKAQIEVLQWVLNPEIGEFSHVEFSAAPTEAEKEASSE